MATTIENPKIENASDALAFISSILRPKGAPYEKGVKVNSREGACGVGTLTGGQRACSCGSGPRLSVRWPAGKITFVCTQAMSYDEAKNEWTIL